MPIITSVQDVGPGLTMPTQHIYLQLADPWTTADYTEITPLVKQWSGTVRGRQHELQLFQPGQVAITLESNLNQGRFNPWNTQSVYYNQLSADDAAQVASNGTWGNATNGTLGTFPTTPPVTLDIGYALKLTCNGTSPSTMRTSSTAYSVVAGQLYSAMCSFLTSATARSCSVGIQWYNSSGSLISTSTSSTVTDSTTAWTKASLLGAQAPTGAVTAAIVVSVAGAANNEVHWACRAALFNYSSNCPNTAWAPGQRGLVPGRPIYCTATWGGVTYPVWSMYVSNFTPSYGQVKSEQVINCSDGMALLALGDISSSAYAYQVLADGAQNFWRCGDPIGSPTAADSGPNGNPLYATLMTFGAQSPLLTDDTTAVTTTTGSLASGPYTIAAGAGSLEFMFNMPTNTASAVFLYGSDQDSFIYFSGSSGQNTLNIGISGVGQITATAPQCDNGLWHHLVVTWSAGTNGTINAYLDGVNIGSLTISGGNQSSLFITGQQFIFGSQLFNGGIGYPFAGSFANIAVYSTALSSTQVTNHYALFSAGFAVQYSGQRIQTILAVIGWPSSLQNVATGVSYVQGATSSLTQTSALSYMQTIESTEMGALFVDPSGNLTFYDRHYIITASAATVSNGTFTNQPNPSGTYFRFMPGLIPAMDDTDLWNDVPAQRNGGVLQRATNATSVKQYLKRTLTGYTGELQTTDAEVLAQAQWLLAHYDSPYTRCRSITISSRTDNGKNLGQMLGRGIFDNITLIWNPIDGSSVYFNQQSLIESIQHTVTQSEWITTWGLSPAETQPYMILNNATRGQLSEGNCLAY